MTDSERELLLIVARWMLRLEEGAFRGFRRSGTTPLHIQSSLDFRTGPLPNCATA